MAKNMNMTMKCRIAAAFVAMTALSFGARAQEIGEDDFNVGYMTDAGSLIKGKIAGVAVTNSSGDPNVLSTVRMRGTMSLLGSNAPLVLVDGVEGDLDTVSPESIESIEVLKDASAAALYGIRGGNGVILIKTRSGRRAGGVQTAYSGYAAIAGYSGRHEFMSAEDIRNGANLLSDLGSETDWIAETTRKAAFIHSHDVRVTGGFENTAFHAGLTYRNTQGNILNTYRKDMNVDAGVTQWLFKDILSVGLDIKGRISDQDVINDADIYNRAMVHNPTSPIYNDDGNFYGGIDYTPVSLLQMTKGNARYQTLRASGKIAIEPIKDWRTCLTVSVDKGIGRSREYTDRDDPRFWWSRTSWNQDVKTTEHTASLIELKSSYEKFIEGHGIRVVAGYERQNNLLDFHNARNGANTTGHYTDISSSKDEFKREGIYYMASYDYDGRYAIQASIRHEGSSLLAKDSKWSTFPAVFASWNIHNESFLKDARWIDALSLRAGYGMAGYVPELSSQALKNDCLRCEKNCEVNIGTNALFLNGRLGIDVTWYHMMINDVIYYYYAPVVISTAPYYDNLGKMGSQGVEIALKARPVERKNFIWNVGVSLWHNTTRLESMHEEAAFNLNDRYYLTRNIAPGDRIDSYSILKAVGISEKGRWLIEDPDSGEATQYLSVMSEEGSRFYQKIGHAIPDVYLAMSQSFNIYGVVVNLLFTGQFGFSILNENRARYETPHLIRSNSLKSCLNPPFNDGNVLSKEASTPITSAHLERGDFLKLANASISYTFKLDSRYMKAINVYVAGSNLFTITGYSGIDPELSNADMWHYGHDFAVNCPSRRTGTLGVRLSF